MREGILWQRGPPEHRGDVGKSRQDQDIASKPLRLEHGKSEGESWGRRGWGEAGPSSPH